MRKQILLCALAMALFVCSLPPLAHAEDAPTVTITALTSTLNPQTKQVKAHLEVHNPTAKPLTGLNANIDVSNASTLDANELCDWLHGGEDNQKRTAADVRARACTFTGMARPFEMRTGSIASVEIRLIVEEG